MPAGNRCFQYWHAYPSLVQVSQRSSTGTQAVLQFVHAAYTSIKCTKRAKARAVAQCLGVHIGLVCADTFLIVKTSLVHVQFTE